MIRSGGKVDWDVPGLAERLAALYVEGKAYSEIAKILAGEFHQDFTRNAVCGQVHRRGLVRPKPARGAASLQGKLNVMQREAKRAALPAPAAPSAPKTPRVSVCDLNKAKFNRAVALGETPAPDVRSAAFIAPPGARLFALVDLDGQRCKWPFDAAGETRFCGEAVKPGEVYCGPHCARAYPSGTFRSGVLRKRDKAEPGSGPAAGWSRNLRRAV